MDDSPQTPLDYAPRPKPASWARMLAYLLVSLAFLLLLLFILAPVLYQLFHHHDHGPASGSNLRQIAQIAHSYTVDHDGHYPDSFETMVRWEHSYLPPQLFASPDGPATPASDFETMFAEPGHISYIWVGAGLTIDSVTGDVPLAYEGPVTDYETGTLVAFVDGSVRRVKGEELRNLLGEAEERLKRATTAPASRPATRAGPSTRRDDAGRVIGMVASTHSVYYDTAEDGTQQNLQMVWKQCVPVENIRGLIE